LHYGIDFEGGTLMQVKFNNNTTAGEIRDMLKNPRIGYTYYSRKCSK